MKIKGADQAVPVNRKLVLALFIITGILSLALWLQGNGEKAQLQMISPVVETKLVPTSEVKKITNYQDELKQRLATASGTYAVYVYDLELKKGWGINENLIMEGASIMKIPPMLAALRQIREGKMELDQKVVLKEVDRSAGSGPLQYVTAGTEISIERILSEMGKKSDNTGWRMLNRVLGRELIESEMLDIGMTGSEYVNYTTTAVDVAKLFERVATDLEIQPYLMESIYEDRISKGVNGDMEVVHKVGTLAGVFEDAGIIRCKKDNIDCGITPFVLVLLNKEVSREQAEKFVPELTNFILMRRMEEGRKYFE